MDFTCVKNRMHALLELGVPGCSISIRHKHKEIYRYVCGETMQNSGKAMTGDERFFIFSCTKPITMAAVMQLVERGVLKLEDEVARFLPEYADVLVDEDGKLVPLNTPITIKHLMTMSAGMDYRIHAAIEAAGLPKDDTVTVRQVAAAMAKQPFCFQPGEKFKYSACHDVIGAVIQEATGMTFGEYLKKNIFDPLGMTHTNFDRNTGDILPQYECLEESGEVVFIDMKHPYNFSKNYESGGGGLVSTLDDYALFADAMACGGVGATGNRILTKESIDAMRENQIGKFVRDPHFSCATGPGYGYGLGVRTLVDKSQGQRSPLGEFGWDGANGAFLIVDPENELSFSFMQNMRNWPRLMGEFYAPIRDEVYDVLGL